MQEIYVRSRGIPRVINIISHVALLLGFNDQEREIGRTVINQVMKGLNFYTPEKSRRHYARQKRDTNGLHTNHFRPPSLLALLVGIAAFSLLGAGVILQSSLASRKLREDTTRSIPSP